MHAVRPLCRDCSYGVYRMEDDRSGSIPGTVLPVAVPPSVPAMPSASTKNHDYRSHPVLTREIRENIFNQAKTGKIILAGMGNALPWPMIFDRLVLDACQVTNPSIDPLREPMELRTYLGKKPASLTLRESKKGEVE